MNTTTIEHRFPVGATIKGRNMSGKIIGIGVDMFGMVMYQISQPTLDGFRRHYIAEVELDGFEVVG